MIAVALLLAAAPADGTIDVAVLGVRDARGRVHVDICDEASFLKDCRWSGEAPAHAGTVIVSVHGVPPGRYAAQAFHDANADGKVEQGIFGIPKEGVGFSNMKLGFSRPKFDKAAFRHDAAAQRIAVALTYYF